MIRQLAPHLAVVLALTPACGGAAHGDAGTDTVASTSGDASTSATTTSTTSATTATTAASGASTSTTTATTSTTDPTTGGTGDSPPPLGPDACQGYATRYWDCCKPHCGWPANVNPATDPLALCDKSDAPIADPLTASACDVPAAASAFTCQSNAPWALSPTLAYGFAAVPASGDICGRCYQLQFDGTGHYDAADPGSLLLAGKTMIVQATNIGYDVGGGQFDILTPGGGVGLFDACSFQWGVDTSELGATYGGFMTYCQQQVGGDHQMLKECVKGRCDAVFADPALAELAAGCRWYVDWYEVADNPNLHYQEVACPAALVAISGIDRAPLGDVGTCEGGGATCTQEEMDACKCDWTNGGTNCGQDDGSCCWTACCG
ncbi:MAG TPA: hypothetical protein PKW35_10535 [Nannocystaceae bacterium]|nr:hypothetical protein [Nannocystaceae bacterium]